MAVDDVCSAWWGLVWLPIMSSTAVIDGTDETRGGAQRPKSVGSPSVNHTSLGKPTVEGLIELLGLKVPDRNSNQIFPLAADN